MVDCKPIAISQSKEIGYANSYTDLNNKLKLVTENEAQHAPSNGWGLRYVIEIYGTFTEHSPNEPRLKLVV